MRYNGGLWGDRRALDDQISAAVTDTERRNAIIRAICRYESSVERVTRLDVLRAIVPDDVMSESVGSGVWSVRARRAFALAGITVVGDLLACSEAELLSWRGCGQTTVQEMRDFLASKGQCLWNERDFVADTSRRIPWAMSHKIARAIDACRAMSDELKRMQR